ncbi:MAG: DUF6285 domain-containing protein [Actinomycetota bacterium]|nr:DUF6285 domain-containing protein [Actinomycetota bacterium]
MSERSELTDLYGSPTAGELLQAVREWLERELVAEAPGRLRFDARVAANVLAIVERELAHGDQHRRRHAERLGSLGVTDDRELAALIRSGVTDRRLAEIAAALAEAVADRLAVDDPRYGA